MGAVECGRIANAGDYSQAVFLSRSGKTKDDVISSLVGQGVFQASAVAAVDEVFKARARSLKTVARRNMALGALVCLGGGVVTVLTCKAAHQPGCMLVVALGAALFGAVQFLSGLFKMLARQ